MGSWEDSVATSVASATITSSPDPARTFGPWAGTGNQGWVAADMALSQGGRGLAPSLGPVAIFLQPLPRMVNPQCDLARLCFQPEAGRRLYKSTVRQAHHQASIKVSPKDTEMKTAEEPAPRLGQTLEWLRKELAEMQIQDQKLLLTLRHLHSVLEELRSESAHWEDAMSSRGTSPIRARAGSEGRVSSPCHPGGWPSSSKG
ncbi:hypothetical protein QTO34_001975 [Cnephaeus nilssonii]|uniref:Uncharacterized protein n=1 Tax=Cnephaeus nilssonii TaxID=3371016 RepID=A0AA40LMZ9_CNENI|nr:hypothetical protein QTO34_001975 [Eptesicus nilssonii]